MIDIEEANRKLRHIEPLKIIEWTVDIAKKPVTTTNFGPHEAVILHMVTQVKPDMPIVWVDTGYNTSETYSVAERLIEQLNLNIKVYTPNITAARQNAALGGIPSIEDEAHYDFTEQFKLEPFTRAMRDEKPDVWFTAVRSEQTAFRKGMDIIGTGPNDMLKVSPVLHWKEADVEKYLNDHQLPNVQDYYDPTKAVAGRECGLHTRL